MGIGMSILVVLVIVIGYLYSDNRYADELIMKHKITNPDTAFRFVISQQGHQYTRGNHSGN